MLVVFFGLFLAVLIGAIIYFANSFSWFAGLDSAWILSIFFAAVSIFMIVGVMGFINATSSTGSIIFRLAAISMGFMLYLLLSTFAVDIFHLFVKLSPKIYGIMAISLAATFSIYGLWHATNTKVTEVDIILSGIQKPIKAAHLTDTHLGHFRGANKMQQIVDMINAEEVDVVFFTGDLLDSKIQLKPESMNPLKHIKAPVFFVEGNHDAYTGIDPIKAHLKSLGVKVLENQIFQWNELQIIGLDHMVADHNAVSPHASSNGPTIQNTLANLNIQKEKPSILLHHGPNGIKYANEAGVDLYLAGHTHGGQLWPITHIATLLFEVNKGLHQMNGTQVYVSQGTGTFGPPMRVGTDSELSILHLLPETTTK